ncbi:hypothetical protein B0H16DRAFT_1236041, partial [Mycena metata]
LLGKMPWGLTKPSDSEPYYSLWRFLGPHWLAGSQLNDTLELLRLKINSTPGLTRDLRVKSIDMTRALLKAYDERDTVSYRTAHDLDWLRILAEDLLGSQASLLTGTHLGPVNDEPHWTAIVVDAAERRINYGDGYGFRAEVPEKLLAVYCWWLGHHTSMDFSVGDLSIATQTDAFSCGMLVGNSLEHFADPSVPLVDAKDWAAARLQKFIEIAERSLEKVR